MKKYEDFLKEYVKRNESVLNENATQKRSLIKFSEAVARAISDSKKSSSGYGTTAESLASAGLSASGLSDYIRAKSEGSFEADLKRIENAKNSVEAVEDELYQKEAARLEQERIFAEGEALKRREQIKKSVASFAVSKGITDYDSLYDYAISLGLDEEGAKEIARESVDKNIETARQKNIDKSRAIIISEKLTKPQAYAYAKSLGLSEEDATALAEFAYEINQNPGYKPESSTGAASAAATPKPTAKPDKSFTQTKLN